MSLGVITNVSSRVTEADAAAFRSVLKLEKREQRPETFAEEIDLIRLVQNRILTAVPINQGIPQFESREPVNLFRLGYGLCYDRSRSIEKALAFEGFETRHVYVLYKGGKSLLRAALTYRQPSHAVTEVRTSRGWMLVDSNSRWIALTKKGEPVPADRVWQRVADFYSVPEGLDQPAWMFQGLYSRKGFFYKPYFPFPEANWLIFFKALFE
jgi:hypothetical protein